MTAVQASVVVADLRVRVIPAPTTTIRRTGRICIESGRGRRIRRHELTVQQAEALITALTAAIEQARSAT